MKTKNVFCGISIAVVLQLGLLAGSAQTNIYLFSGSKTNITLPPGTYIITAYGAPGGGGYYGGFGAEMTGEFTFSTSTTLTGGTRDGIFDFGSIGDYRLFQNKVYLHFRNFALVGGEHIGSRIENEN